MVMARQILITYFFHGPRMVARLSQRRRRLATLGIGETGLVELLWVQTGKSTFHGLTGTFQPRGYCLTNPPILEHPLELTSRRNRSIRFQICSTSSERLQVCPWLWTKAEEPTTDTYTSRIQRTRHQRQTSQILCSPAQYTVETH